MSKTPFSHDVVTGSDCALNEAYARALDEITSSMREGGDLEGTAEAGDPGAEILDSETIATLRSLRRGTRSILSQLLVSFAEGTQPLIDDLRAATNIRDRKAIVHAAHTLKGTSLTIGAKRLGALSAEIERLGRAEQLDDLEPLVATMQDEFDLAREAAEREIAREG